MENNKINNTKKYIVKGAKGVAFFAKWFLVGYGLAAISGDIMDCKKKA